MDKDTRAVFSANLQRLMENMAIDRYKLSDDLDIKYSTLGNWIQEKAFPRIDALEDIATYFNVEVIDLLTDSEDRQPKAVRINVYGAIPAGVPLEAIEFIDGFEEIPREWTLGNKEYIALRVQGDSMFPEYLEGDVVIVLLCSDFDNGDDCVVFIDGYDATLKRCYRTDKGIQLKPLNQAYPPKTYGEGDDPIEILGIVKEIRRKIK